MNDLLVRRGPDDQGIWANDERGIFFDHTRLSIIDVSNKGHQPMVSSQGDAIVFNGEIHNFDELKKADLTEPFRSRSDTEVVLRHDERRGTRALDDFNGMFAFAIWDSVKKKPFLARDRIGIKPLYYTTKNGIFAISSKIMLSFLERNLSNFYRQTGLFNET